MKPGRVLISLLVAAVVFAGVATLPAAAAEKRGQGSVPQIPEIPTSDLPPSLEIPFVAQALATEEGPEYALRVVAAFLELTDEQVASLTTLLEQRNEAIAPLVEEIHARQQQLAEELQSGNPAPGTVGQLVIEIHQFGELIRQAQQSFLESFTSLLNQEQQRRYQAIRMAERLRRFLPAFERLRLI